MERKYLVLAATLAGVYTQGVTLADFFDEMFETMYGELSDEVMLEKVKNASPDVKQQMLSASKSATTELAELGAALEEFFAEAVETEDGA